MRNCLVNELINVWVISIGTQWASVLCTKKNHASFPHPTPTLPLLPIQKTQNNLHCVCVFVHACACACMHAHLCLTLCNPVDCSPPNSSVHGTLQARILKWVAIFYLRRSSWTKDRTCVSCLSCIGRRVLFHCTTWEALLQRHKHVED